VGKIERLWFFHKTERMKFGREESPVNPRRNNRLASSAFQFFFFFWEGYGCFGSRLGGGY
jgi:hypothetical protein